MATEDKELGVVITDVSKLSEKIEEQTILSPKEDQLMIICMRNDHGGK